MEIACANEQTYLLELVAYQEKFLDFKYQSENPLRCTTQDKKDLVLIAILFYLIF